MDTDSASTSVREIRALLARCDNELESAAEGSVLRSRFGALVTPTIVQNVLGEAIECEAFALGAFDAAERADSHWPVEDLVQIGELLAHHGHTRQAGEVAAICFRRSPGSTRTIILWAETAPSAAETISRFAAALASAREPDAVAKAALHFATHSPDSQMLIERLTELRSR
jgi:hypothetical protein